MDRSEKILRILTEAQSWIKSSEIALHLNVSTRTVRNDIKAIKEKYGQDIINASNIDGYKINEEYIKILENKQNEANITQNGRLLILLKILILNEDGVDIYTLAETLYVSEHTIESDITKIRRYINRLGNTVAKIVRHGDIVKLISKNTVRNSLLYDVFINEFEGIKLNDFQKCFENIKLIDIYKELRWLFVEKKLEFKQLSFLKLTLEIAILIEKEINHSYSIFEDVIVDDSSKEIASIINNMIKSMYEVELTKSNKIYLDFVFERLYKLRWIEDNYDEYLLKNLTMVKSIRLILEKIITDLGISVLENSIYVDGLINHILMSIERKKLGLNSFNPLMNNLKNEYQYYYSIAITITNRLKTVNEDINLNIDDISYIASYLVAIVEKSKEDDKDKLVKIAVVVPEGLSNLFYVASYVKKIVGNKNVLVNTFLRLEDINENKDYRIIISTNNLSLIYENTVLISKSFNNIDKLKVKNIIDKEVNLQKKGEFRESAIKFFRKDLFFNNINIKSKKEAIKYLCDKLCEDGAVEEDFYEHVINRENVFDSSIDSSVALPNELFYEAKKTRAAIVVLKDGIQWGNNKVKVIMTIAVTKSDREKYINFISELNKILLNNSIWEYSVKCENGIQFRYMIEHLFLKEWK